MGRRTENGDVNLDNRVMSGVPDPTQADHVANRSYVDANSGGGGGTTVTAVTDGSTNTDTTLTGLTIGTTDYNIPGGGTITRFIDEIATVNQTGFLKNSLRLDVRFTSATSPTVDTGATYAISITGPQGDGTGPVMTSVFSFQGSAVTRTVINSLGEWRIDHTHSSWTTLSGTDITDHSDGGGGTRVINALGPVANLDYLVAGEKCRSYRR